jgi:hypothetical protein
VVRTETEGTATIRRNDGGDVRVRYAAKQTTVAGLTLYVSVAFLEPD